MENQTSNLPKEISWVAPEYPDFKKHPMWYVGFGLLMAALVAYGILTDSWTTSIMFGLFGVLGVYYAAQKPKNISIKLDGVGLQIDNITYNYKVLKKFWILYNPTVTKALYFETTAYIDRVLRVELTDQDPLVLKNFLKQYLEEDLEQEESASEVIARKLKF